MLRDLVREAAPFGPWLSWRQEAAVLTTLRGSVEEESRRPEVLKKLRREAQSRMGPAGTPAGRGGTERLRGTPGKTKMAARGRGRAESMGVCPHHSFHKGACRAPGTAPHRGAPPPG